jgi:hypothetical protein
VITKRDKEIIKFTELHGSITIKQCSKIFFKNNREAYDQARKRLRVIYTEGLLKRYRKDPRSEAVYFIDKKLKIHDLKLLDVLAELNDFNLFQYTKEKKFEINEDKKYIIDAILNIERAIGILIEIDYTHYTSIDKIRDMIYFLENKHKKSYYFLVVKFSQEEIEIKKIGDFSKLIFLPWSLEEFSQVTSSLRSDIGKFESRRNLYFDGTSRTY